MHLPVLENLPFLNKIPFLNQNTPYWVKIRTAQPKCIYYFGPFDNPQEAKLNQNGYVEDLIGENTSGIYVEIKKCKPKILTVYEEE
ncbi:MAG: DUF1816 domain-containing protein [Cyanobacteria bacterium P01_H01_bin.150]